jgi:hypothetical protein
MKPSHVLINLALSVATWILVLAAIAVVTWIIGELLQDIKVQNP